jgi:hypothetical protein
VLSFVAVIAGVVVYERFALPPRTEAVVVAPVDAAEAVESPKELTGEAAPLLAGAEPSATSPDDAC